MNQLRLLFKNIGVEKPCEETLKSIEELVIKEGNDLMSHNELRRVIASAVETLKQSDTSFK